MNLKTFLAVCGGVWLGEMATQTALTNEKTAATVSKIALSVPGGEETIRTAVVATTVVVILGLVG